LVGSRPNLRRRRSRLWVGQLVSPNPKPITGDEDDSVAPDYRLPPGFDQEKQKRVREAIVGLRKIGPRAFPPLIERWGDKRYCVTAFHKLSEYSHNLTVGDISKAIIFDQLQPYSNRPRSDDDPRGKPKRPGYPSEFLWSQKAAKAWWEKNKHKSIIQMQLDVLDWVIAEEAKRPNDSSAEERRFVRNIRAELVKRREPMPPGNYTWEQVEL
jgi:hypothetical protein